MKCDKTVLLYGQRNHFVPVCLIKLWAISIFIIIFSHSKANIYAEDETLYTPVLTAAAHNKVEAFHCLMNLMDLKDDMRNPIFQVLQVKKHQAETLIVSLHNLKISMSWLLTFLNLSFYSSLLLTLSGDPDWSNQLTARRTVCCMSLQGRITYQPWQSWRNAKLKVILKM